MTKKHYVALAAALRIDWNGIQQMPDGATKDGMVAGFGMALETLLVSLQGENSRFDRARFMDAVRGQS